MKPTKFNTRLTAIILILLLFVSLFSGCKKDEKKDEGTGKKASASTTVKSKDKKAKDEKASGETTTAASGKSSETTTAKPIAAAPVSTPSNSNSGGTISAGGSPTQNATSATDLNTVDPAAAAQNSYDTTVTEQAKDVSTIDPSQYTYVAKSDFDSHIENVWGSFTVNEKIKVDYDKDNKYVNEYINHIVLPIKNTFADINCNGCSYYAGSDGTYTYLDITWSYYINQSQYSTCKSLASSITSKATGSVANKVKVCHDQICAINTYGNADGAYNCLQNHCSDCDGYTAAFKICMDLLGIPCKAYATTDHIFNLVQVDGSWYAVDVTWDDADDYGMAIEKYLLNGRNIYTAPSNLTSLLPASRYGSVDRCGYIYNQSKFCTAVKAPSGYTNPRFTAENVVTFDVSGGGTATCTFS